VVVNILDDGPRDCQAIISAGDAAYFVQDQQRAARCMVKDVCRLNHLNHERRLAARNFVRCADAREDSIHQTNTGRVGRDKRADLCHEDNGGDLPNPGGFARHVRPCQNDDSLVGCEICIVGCEKRTVL